MHLYLATPGFIPRKILRPFKIYGRFQRRIFLLIVFLAIVLGKTAFAGQAEIDKQYQQAKTLNQFEHIAEEIRQVLQLEPSNPGWQWRLARSHYAIAKRTENDDIANHHYDLCIKHSSQTLEMQPNSAIGYFFRAICRGKQGEMKGMWSSLGAIDPFEEDMKKALALDPAIQNGGPNRALGKLYLELPFFLGGSNGKAINHLKEAVRLGPDYAENHLGLAQAYYAKNNYTAAQKTLSTLLSLTDNGDEDLLKLRKKGQALMDKIASYSPDL